MRQWNNPFPDDTPPAPGVNTSPAIVATSSLPSNALTPPANTGPVNKIKPLITGNEPVGSKLTCNDGQWEGIPTPKYTYQWYRGSIPISGKNTNEYTTETPDIGQKITCKVTATNSDGVVTAESSNAITPTSSTPITLTDSLNNTTKPKITPDEATQGDELTCSPGIWSGTPDPEFTYQWARNNTPISDKGKDKNTYTITTADIGTSITCIVTATRGGKNITAISEPFTPKKKEEEKEEEKDVAAEEKKYFDEYFKLLTHKAKLVLPEKETSQEEEKSGTGSLTTALASEKSLVSNVPSYNKFIKDVEKIKNSKSIYADKIKAIEDLQNDLNQHANPNINVFEITLKQLTRTKEEIDQRQALISGGLRATQQVTEETEYKVKELQTTLTDLETKVNKKLALIKGCSGDMNTTFASGLLERAKETAAVDAPAAVGASSPTTSAAPAAAPAAPAAAAAADPISNVIEKANSAIQVANTNIQKYKNLVIPLKSQTTDTAGSPPPSPDFDNIIEKYKITLETIDAIIAANKAAFEAFVKFTTSNAIDLYKPENEDSNSKLYNPAIEAITSAIDKVTAADSAPSSGAADAAAADAAAAAADAAVRAAIKAVNKTNYNNDAGYKKQLDADVGKVEKATGSNLIKLLENLLFLVISKLDPVYKKAVDLVDEATNAAADAASNAEKAKEAKVAAERAVAAAEEAGATGAADDAAPPVAAAAAAIAAAAVERTTIKTEDAVSDATIYNNFFKTITSMKKEYGLVKTACTEVTTSLTLTDSSSPINFSNVKSKLEALKVALEALKTKFDEKYNPDSEPGVFSLFDGGGSKTKSKSSSSHKSKSKSKNKTKNKTKKNHSHSDKRKIPKIKMN